MTKYEVELALSHGHLWAAMRNGRYWQLRRNGATQTWKTRPSAFSVPVKAGLKTCTRITETSSVSLMGDVDWRAAHFVVSIDDPNNAIVGAAL
jgi:hypothetical protein